MSRRKIQIRLAALLGLVYCWLPSAAHACATCYGDPDSPQTKGLNGAIITMLVITYGLFALAGLGVFLLIRRSVRAEESSDDAPVAEGEPTHG
jgi:hypothetical protein